MDSVTHDKRGCSKLCRRIDGPSKIIKKIIKNAYKVKDLRPYHGEDLRTSLFSQL